MTIGIFILVGIVMFGLFISSDLVTGKKKKQLNSDPSSVLLLTMLDDAEEFERELDVWRTRLCGRSAQDLWRKASQKCQDARALEESMKRSDKSAMSRLHVRYLEVLREGSSLLNEAKQIHASTFVGGETAVVSVEGLEKKPGKCPICGFDFKALADETTDKKPTYVPPELAICQKCDVPHCSDCWDYNESCAAFACNSKSKKLVPFKAPEKSVN